MKFVKFVEQWKRDHRGETSEGWKVSQDQMLRDYILPLLGKKQIKSIKPIDILRTLNKMREKERSSQLIVHVYNLLNIIFKAYIQFESLLTVNPVLPQFRPKIKNKEARYWSVEHSFIFLTKSIGHRYEVAFFIALLCGLRVGEIQGLRWEDSFDWTNKEIIVRRHYCRKTKKMLDRTKNGRILKIPMPELLFEFLLKRKKRDGWSVGYKTRHLGHCHFHVVLKLQCEKLKLPVLSAHGLRHSCTEIWVEKGATQTLISRLLNHVTEKSTPRYMHRADKGLKDIAAKMTWKSLG